MISQMIDVFNRNVQTQEDIISFIPQLALFNVTIVASAALGNDMSEAGFLEGIELINKCTDEYDQQFIGTKFFRKDNNGG